MFDCPVEKCFDKLICNAAPRTVSKVVGAGFDAAIKAHGLFNTNKQPVELPIIFRNINAHRLGSNGICSKDASVDIVERVIAPIAFGVSAFANDDNSIHIFMYSFPDHDTKLGLGVGTGGGVVGGVTGGTYGVVPECGE